ncbi:MAG: lipopolysaccharide kinase InaA family protein [Patescibacteria group bacterium]
MLLEQETQILYTDETEERISDPNTDLSRFCRNRELRPLNQYSSSAKISVPEGVYYSAEHMGIQEVTRINRDRGKQQVLAGNSAHHVDFLTMDYRSEKGKPVQRMGIAVKEYADYRGGLVEWRKMDHVEQEGITTFERVFFARIGSRGYLATRSDLNMVGLDRYNWADLYNQTSNYEESKKLLYGIAISLADIHARGIQHGDTQIKNFALNTNSREVFIIDWEAANFKKDGIVDTATKDLRILFLSAIGDYENVKLKIIKGGICDSSWDMFKELIFDVYLAGLVEYGVEIDDATARAIEVSVRNSIGL